MADFSASEMDSFRKISIRDYVNENDGDYLSGFNKSHNREFLDDPMINELLAEVDRDFELQLESVWDERKQLRLEDGDSTATAETNADAAKLVARKALLRAKVRELMIADPSYNASLGDKDTRSAIIAIWQDQSQSDRNFVRARSGPGYSTVNLHRR